MAKPAGNSTKSAGNLTKSAGNSTKLSALTDSRWLSLALTGSHCSSKCSKISKHCGKPQQNPQCSTRNRSFLWKFNRAGWKFDRAGWKFDQARWKFDQAGWKSRQIRVPFPPICARISTTSGRFPPFPPFQGGPLQEIPRVS